MKNQPIRGRETPQTEQPETVCIFRTFKDNGEVIALFVEIADDLRGELCSSYMTIGQHAGADYHALTADRYNTPTRRATAEEYAALRRELESDPYCYRLKIQERATAANHEKRRQNARELYRRMTA